MQAINLAPINKFFYENRFMSKIHLIWLTSLFLFLSGCAGIGIPAYDFKNESYDKKTLTDDFDIKARLEQPITEGEENKVLLKFTRLNEPVTLEDLDEVHKHKIHLLINDSSLSDYFHKHPKPTKNKGEYEFSFTPKTSGPYKIWAEIYPLETGIKEVAITQIGPENLKEVAKDVSNKFSDGGLEAELSFDKKPKSGKASTGKIVIKKDGELFKGLEPVMGAFGHIVAFADDFYTVAHVHPMGKEPKKDSERGGPNLSFHFKPETVGFYKIYAQVKISNEAVFIPFGVEVE